MSKVSAITVFCSSSTSVPSIYFDAAAEVGRAIADSGWSLVYGGNCIGCMKSLADGARAAGGKVIGVTPQLLVDKGIADTRADELIVTATMRERKAIMEQRGDAFLSLPGGLGTLEEIFEIIVGRSLGYHDKPIVLLNTAGYYDPLLRMIEHGIEHRFIKGGATELFEIADRAPEAIKALKRDL